LKNDPGLFTGYRLDCGGNFVRLFGFCNHQNTKGEIMALIGMAIYDTPENGRDLMTEATLNSLVDTVDFDRHRLVCVVNAATERTISAIADMGGRLDSDHFEVIYCATNVGTARAVNRAWLLREPGEHAIKMDNDVVINYPLSNHCWVDIMEDAIRRDTQIGIIGLKRKDCIEDPEHPNEFYRSTIKRLPHQPGERHIIVEQVSHVMGTCQMYSSALLDKIGYLYQPGLYGWDDVLAAVRCKVAGFYSCFLPGIDIDHIDPGGTPFQGWKEDQAWHDNPERNRLEAGYKNGTIPIWYGPNGEQR
jgi:GT2 family glycosyltransferase